MFIMPRNNYDTEAGIKKLTGLPRLVVSPVTPRATLLNCPDNLKSKGIEKDKLIKINIIHDGALFEGPN